MKKTILILLYVISIQYCYACKSINNLSVEEMLIEADSIVVATVLGFKTTNNISNVLFETDKLVHGDYAKQYLLFKGEKVNTTLQNKSEVPYTEGRRRLPGNCTSEDYEIGVSYLLILKNGTPYWSPFNPVNEKLIGEFDPWLMWIEGFFSGRQFQSEAKNIKAKGSAPIKENNKKISK